MGDTRVRREGKIFPPTLTAAEARRGVQREQSFRGETTYFFGTTAWNVSKKFESVLEEMQDTQKK